MKTQSNFYTLKGYELLEHNPITPAMEDYLEMIYRILQKCSFVRINVLAKRLNVKPSSASKMVSNLKEKGLVSFEKYGYIILTKGGEEIGSYLLKRHNILNELLCMINKSDNELEQVEKIEHYFNTETISNIEEFIKEQKNTAE